MGKYKALKNFTSRNRGPGPAPPPPKSAPADIHEMKLAMETVLKYAYM